MFDIALCGPRPLLTCGPSYDPEPAATVAKPKRKAKRKSKAKAK